MNFDRVRTLILQQAIRGRLVTHIDTEKPVHVNNKVTLNVPYELPETWLWVRGDEILEFIRGVTFPASAKQSSNSEGTVRCLTTGSVQRLHNPVADVFIQSSYVKKDRQYLQKNDIVISTANSKELVGKCIRWKNVDSKVSFGGFLTVARSKNSEIDSNFVYYVFQSLFYSRYFANLSTQTTNIANLSNALLSGVLFPVPPIEEQLRIVTKLDEAFAEIDRAEKAYQELQTLSGVLRGQILQEAIQGKLVPQLDSEGAVEQIGDAPEDVPFAIPDKWKWVQLKSVGTVVGGGTPKTSVSEYWGDDVSWITPADLGKNSSKWIHKGAKSITKKGLNESSAKLMPEGSVVYSSRAPIGHIAIAGQELCTNQGCKSFVPNAEVISTEWAYYMLIARTKDIQSRASGTTFKEISGKGVGETWITLPPLEEQKRIVAKIEDLLKQVDALSAR